jgi:uncharacterized protein YegJ (DUF2314 family)
MRILVRQVIRQTDAAHTSVDPSKEDRRKKERKMMMMMWRRREREAGRKKMMIFFGMGRFPFHRNAQTGKNALQHPHTHTKKVFSF